MIFIISLLIFLSGLTMAYAYWTDIINTEISIAIPYDVYLKVENITIPEAGPQDIEEDTLELDSGNNLELKEITGGENVTDDQQENIHDSDETDIDSGGTNSSDTD
jgi:hypothetical protein